MSGQNANDAFAGRDDAFFAQQLGAGDARSTCRFAAEAVGADLGLSVEDLLIGHLADDAIAPVQGAQALGEVHRAVDFDGTGNRVGFGDSGIQFSVIVGDRGAVDVAVVPADVVFIEE